MTADCDEDRGDALLYPSPRDRERDPEVRNLRDDVSRFRNQSIENELRLNVIESHIGIKSAFEPS